MAQGALDTFIEQSKARTRAAKPGLFVPVSGSPLIQSRIGNASATIESAFSMLLNSVIANLGLEPVGAF